MSNFEIFHSLFDCAVMASRTLDLQNTNNKKILANILESCGLALNPEAQLPKASIIQGLEERSSALLQKMKRDGQKYFTSALLVKELELGNSACYQSFFNMNKNKFQLLLSLTISDLEKNGLKVITPAEQLAVTLRFLATGESYKCLTDLTKIPVKYIAKAIPLVCQSVWKHLRNIYVKFPAEKIQWEVIAKGFEDKYEFPNCLGAIDVLHIEFRAERKNGIIFENFNGSRTLKMLAMADANRKFIYVDVGQPGRLDDADVLINSALQSVLFDAKKRFPKDRIIGIGRCVPYVIIADEYYSFERHLMLPYIGVDDDEQDKKVYNIRLAHARRPIDEALRCLANRFKILQTNISLGIENVKFIILACCCLHNYQIDTVLDYINGSAIGPTNDEESIEYMYHDDDQAELVRTQFMEYFNNEGKVTWQTEKA